MKSNHPSNERPGSEPEIIPPEHIEASTRNKQRSFHQRRTYRFHVTRPGPLSLALVLIMLAAFVAIVSLILIGAFLILIPLAVLLIAAALMSRMFRR